MVKTKNPISLDEKWGFIFVLHALSTTKGYGFKQG
jgi:hypothetical protein